MKVSIVLVYIATLVAVAVISHAQTLWTPGGTVGNISGSNVGIGVQAGFSDPTAGNVAFGGGAKLILWNDVTTPQKLSIGIDANADMWFNNAGNQAGAGFTFYTGNGVTAAPTARLKFTKEGNVGIGTTTPGAKLDVNGNVYVQGSGGIAVDVLRPYLSGVSITNGPASQTYLIVKGSTDNVGIGTTNPTQKLSVNGAIRAKEVIVEGASWSDYVFAEGYRLSALSEVEAHIKKHQHLPGIPSASEVAEHGISVGEMQAKLLAKIEELTLHVIAQEKEINALRGEVEYLKRTH